MDDSDTSSSKEGKTLLTCSTSDFISSGDFGILNFVGILLLEEKEEKRPVNVIRIQLANVESDKVIKLFEKNVINKVNEDDPDCIFILHYLHIQLDDPFLYLATEQWGNETLKDLIDGELPRAKEIIVGHEKNILRQVTRGLDYLHSKEIIHMDMKPSNIIICKSQTTENDTPRVKLANFAICGTLMKTAENKRPLGSPGWTPPESFKTDCVITRKVDIFSLGLVFYYTLTVEAKHPFGKTTLEQTVGIQKMPDGGISLEQKDFKSPYCDDSEAVMKLIKSMCERNPEQRPTTAQVLMDTFFSTQEIRTPLVRPQGSRSGKQLIRQPTRVSMLINKPQRKRFKKSSKIEKENPTKRWYFLQQKKNPDREKKTHGPGFSYKS